MPGSRGCSRSSADCLTGGGQVRDLGIHCHGLPMHADARLALDQAVAIGAGEGEALLLLAWWTNSRSQGIGSASITAALQAHVDALAASLVGRCVELFDRLLGGYPIDGWRLSRTRRLQHAIARSSP